MDTNQSLIGTLEPVVRWEGLSNTTRTRLVMLWRVDLAFLVEQLVWKDKYDQALAEQAVQEYRKWLACLIAVLDPEFRRRYFGGKKPFMGMPSKHVDQAWHRHLLFTAEYYQFCLQVAGQMLHHSPCTKQNVSTMHTDSTQRIYAMLFGPMPAIWYEREKFLDEVLPTKPTAQASPASDSGVAAVIPIIVAESLLSGDASSGDASGGGAAASCGGASCGGGGGCGGCGGG